MEPELKRKKWTSPDDSDDSKMEDDQIEINKEQFKEKNVIEDVSKD